MSSHVPACRTITVFSFRGDRSKKFVGILIQALDDEKKRRGPPPSLNDCLLYAGHAGVSIDDRRTIYGFNPDGAGIPVWQLMDGLKNGDAFPGVVRDDTAVFAAAQKHGLTVLSFDIVLPDPTFRLFSQELDSQRQNSQYLYGFPNGDGDCNCVTWLERLGLPLLTGRIDEFVFSTGVVSQLRRRFGKCI